MQRWPPDGEREHTRPMTTLALLRHAPTEWNAARRLQGRADIPLSAAARTSLATRRLPSELTGFRCLVSPLTRARETAILLGQSAEIDARLVEMDWGRYEGRTIADLRREHGEAFIASEARGLDFTPEGGESPRAVQARIIPLLAEIASRRRSTLAITHRGVIRAIYAQASGWNMTGDPPHELDLYAMQIFTLRDDGEPQIERLNVPLEERAV
jgi:broad specificity phosphatase PhoE